MHLGIVCVQFLRVLKGKGKGKCIAVCVNTYTTMGNHLPYGITQCYLPHGRGDFPAFTPAEAGTRFSDPEGMQAWVDLGTVGANSLPKTATRLSRLRFEPVLFRAWVRHTNHSATEPPDSATEPQF